MPRSHTTNGKPGAPVSAARQLRLRLKRFGPIWDADLELRPLTILIGPNGSGKSYAAKACSALQAGLDTVRSETIWLTGGVIDDPLLASSPKSKWFAELLRDVWGWPDVVLPSGGPESAARLLSTTADRCWPSLAGYTQRQCVASLGAEFQAADFGALRLAGEAEPWRIELRCGAAAVELAEDRSLSLQRQWDAEAADWRLDLAASSWHLPRQVAATLTEAAVAGLASASLHPLRVACHLLPAERAGLLAALRTSAAALFRGASEPSRPAAVGLSQAHARFYEDLLGLDPQVRGAYHGLADDLERHVLQASVVARQFEGSPPRLSLQRGETEVPIERESSGSAALAALVLLLRHVLRSNALLIYEEPEINLHPALLRKLARFLARAVNSGLRLLITTHSDYLLSQFSNLVVASGLSAEQRRRAGLARRDVLRPDQVSAYLVGPRRGDTGCAARSLAVTGAHGIDQSAFADVAAKLYQQTYDLHRSLGRVDE